MGSGCLTLVFRWMARACWRLGGRLAYVLITTLAFLLTGVIGPLCLGMTREVIRGLTGGWQAGDRLNLAPVPSTRLGYILLSGALWAIASVILSKLVGLLSDLFSRAIPVPYRLFVSSSLVFIAGAVVGVLAFEYDQVHRYVA